MLVLEFSHFVSLHEKQDSFSSSCFSLSAVVDDFGNPAARFALFLSAKVDRSGMLVLQSSKVIFELFALLGMTPL